MNVRGCTRGFAVSAIVLAAWGLPAQTSRPVDSAPAPNGTFVRVTWDHGESVEIHGDGIGRFTRHADDGWVVRQVQMTPDAVTALGLEAERIGFFDLPNFVHREWAHSSEFIIEVHFRGLEHRVRIDSRSKSVPDELWAFKKRIYEVSGAEVFRHLPAPFVPIDPVIRDPTGDWIARHTDADGIPRGSAIRALCDSRPSQACGGVGDPALDLGTAALASSSRRMDAKAQRAALARLRFFLAQQRADGSFGDPSQEFASLTQVWVTAAPWQFHANEPRAATHRAIRRSVEFVAARLRPDGAWAGPARLDDGDLISTTWALFVMNAARGAGIPVDEEAEARARRFVLGASSEGPSAGGTDSSPVTAPLREFRRAGMRICAARWGGARIEDAAVQRDLERLMAVSRPWSAARAGVDWNALWFGVMATESTTGGPDRWRDEMREFLSRSAAAHGCAAGSFEPSGPLADAFGRLGSTAMARLCEAALLHRGSSSAPRKSGG